jgi:hypothetical protein
MNKAERMLKWNDLLAVVLLLQRPLVFRITDAKLVVDPLMKKRFVCIINRYQFWWTLRAIQTPQNSALNSFGFELLDKNVEHNGKPDSGYNLNRFENMPIDTFWGSDREVCCHWIRVSFVYTWLRWITVKHFCQFQLLSGPFIQPNILSQSPWSLLWGLFAKFPFMELIISAI